jgi:hypothetical protein
VTSKPSRAAVHSGIASEEKRPLEIERVTPSANIRNMSNNVPLHTRRLAAALGQVDQGTITRVLDGKPTRPATRERALEGLRQAGVAELDIDTIAAAKGDGRRLGEVADSAARVGAQRAVRR